MEQVRIAVAGAGQIGRKHIALLARHPTAKLAAIVDPSPQADTLALEAGVRRFPNLAELFAANAADGVILSTPTQLHLDHGLECIAAGIPVLVEKPVTASLDEAAILEKAAAAAGVAVLVGHHRRHNPLIAKARAMVADGLLGRVVAVQAAVLFYKPEDYFAPEWRRKSGAGPLLTNLIHDIDTMRHIIGEISSVQALSSNAIRGFETEDTAAITLLFANGALGTITVSDTAVAPWSWELTAGENPAYPVTGQNCTMITGTEGALEIPGLRHWHYGDGPKGWQASLKSEFVAITAMEPLAAQISHFADMIEGRAAPLVSIADAARSVAVIDAIKRAAESGRSETVLEWRPS